MATGDTASTSASLQPTYEELKRLIEAQASLGLSFVYSLPMRN